MKYIDLTKNCNELSKEENLLYYTHFLNGMLFTIKSIKLFLCNCLKKSKTNYEKRKVVLVDVHDGSRKVRLAVGNFIAAVSCSLHRPIVYYTHVVVTYVYVHNIQLFYLTHLPTSTGRTHYILYIHHYIHLAIKI